MFDIGVNVNFIGTDQSAYKTHLTVRAFTREHVVRYTKIREHVFHDNAISDHCAFM